MNFAVVAVVVAVAFYLIISQMKMKKRE